MVTTSICLMTKILVPITTFLLPKLVVNIRKPKRSVVTATSRHLWLSSLSPVITLTLIWSWFSQERRKVLIPWRPPLLLDSTSSKYKGKFVIKVLRHRSDRSPKSTFIVYT